MYLLQGVSVSADDLHMATETSAQPLAETLREQVAAAVRAQLAWRQISGSALARLLGREQTWVSRRLNGSVAFDLDDLQAIAEALRFRVDVLLGGGPTNGPRVAPPSGLEPETYRLTAGRSAN
jgi:transcriptional regulator with XRE-family HTH domain